MPDNHLANQTSPYLLQHADNPVEWYPWGEQALTKARQENKPILLSIGYSACHWCHVMAHESFEDPQTAAVMNQLFVNIKVDREERPDIDKIYQTAQYLLTQRNGGWPLTMFLTPNDHIPFFGGTYFPDKPRHSLPAFKDLLRHIAKAYNDKRQEISAQNKSLQDVLKNIYQASQAPVTLDERLIRTARDELLAAFDSQHGGFGGAPKFPQRTNIELLMHAWQSSDQTSEENQPVLHAAFFTLEKMASGGLFDHVGGGFCRYSVDAYWMIPHFEKMLYDNGALLSLYSQAFQATQAERFKTAATATAAWVMREMQSTQGGYYSSLDADSEGVEGKFYVWEKPALQTLLSAQEFAVVEQRFGLARAANFEGRYHLHEFVCLADTAANLHKSEADCVDLWRQARKKLFAERSKRIRPARDDKVLTSWNALMIKGMLIAGRTFKNHDYFTSAQRALAFIITHMRAGRRLYASYKDGTAHLNAYLDDYAFLLDAILEYLQTQWDSHYLSVATDIADVLLEQFEDEQHGGFFFTANDHETLLQRPKPDADEATPSGNGVAAHSLLRLGYLLSNTRYIEAAERTLAYASQAMRNSPVSHGALLACWQAMAAPLTTIILRGNANDMRAWQDYCQRSYNPYCMTFAIPSDSAGLPQALQTKFADKHKTLAYICKGASCQAPVEDFDRLKESLIE